MKDTIEHITEILQAYEQQLTNPDIENLIRMRSELAIYSFRFGSILADLNEKYNLSYFQRKIQTSKQKANFVNKHKMPVNKATISADIECEEVILKETEAQSLADRAKILLDQTNKVMDAISQHVSYLKYEKQNG